MKKESAKITPRGMGGFLNPPTHPEHGFSVESMFRNQFSMSLSSAVECHWLADSIREQTKALLDEWKKPALESDEIKAWVLQVLGYFRNCYKGQPTSEDKPDTAWHAGQLRIDKDADPMRNIDLHAGVHFIRKFYPEFVPTKEDFAQACWNN